MSALEPSTVFPNLQVRPMWKQIFSRSEEQPVPEKLEILLDGPLGGTAAYLGFRV